MDADFNFTIYLVLFCNKNKCSYPCSGLCHYFPLTCELKSADCRANAGTDKWDRYAGRLTIPKNWTTGNWFSARSSSWFSSLVSVLVLGQTSNLSRVRSFHPTAARIGSSHPGDPELNKQQKMKGWIDDGCSAADINILKCPKSDN